TPPVAPTWHCPECPRPLESLILRLLAKDPAERPESAADVLAALESMDLTMSVETPTSIDEAHALDSLAGGVFVGRQREMGELKAALEDALSGRGRLVTLVGEPGIGKTRTAQELATYAGMRGAQVLWGRCYEDQGVPPYWPWVQAIRSYVREVEPEQLRSEMGAGAADIAEVVSDVKERLPDLIPPPLLDSPEQARFRLFDSITAFLKSASQRQPLVLVLDDLHWADTPSLLLLQFVASEIGSGGRLLLLGTYRDVELSRQHPLAETLGQLTRERLFQRVLLRGLTRQDVDRFIEIATGVAPPAGLVQSVYTQTEGNPLFVTEVVRLLAQEGELSPEHHGDQDSWSVRVPEGVREVIGRRLNRLTQRCNETLTITSVIGREFTLDQLAPLIDDVTGDRLLEVLEEALAARVIEELPHAVGYYQFTHALIRETLNEELSTTRRVRLHARIAVALEELYGFNVEAHASELAHHFAEAESVLGTEKLVSYSLLAGEKALRGYACEDALTHFERALAAKDVPAEGSGAAPDAEAAALLFGLGRARLSALERLQSQQGLDNLGRAFDFYEKTGDVSRAVAVAEYPMPMGHQGRTEVAQYISRALKLVPPDAPAAGRLLSNYGLELGLVENDNAGAQEAFNRALSIADRENDVALKLHILTSVTEVDHYQLNLEELSEKVSEAIRLSQFIDDQQAVWAAHNNAARILLLTNGFDSTLAHATLSLELADKLRDRSRQAAALRNNAHLYRHAGNWQSAREFTDKSLALSPLDPNPLIDLAIMAIESGDFDQAESYLGQFLQAPTPVGTRPSIRNVMPALVIPWVSRITGATDRLDVAEAAAQAFLSSTNHNPIYGLICRVGLGWLAVVRNDASAASEQYAALEVLPRFVCCQYLSTSRDHMLGLLAHTVGNLDEAVTHFEAALDLCRKAGYRPELAWTCCDYADTLLHRDNPGDRERAMTLLDESLAISSELGMRPLMERVLSRRDILKA
ncbi:MAG: AAA family ATPase, partial [Dehalococcoidia bacterium]